jgi:hypothetical protein
MATSSVQPPDPEQQIQDANMPDPSPASVFWAAAFLAVAITLAALADATNFDKDPPFNTRSVPEPGLALFAGFVAAAVIVERTLELIAPFIPWWNHPGRDLLPAPAEPMDSVKQAAISQKKVDRGYAMITVSASLGVLASAACGLYFADAVGISISRWADILLTGVTIGAGAKGLHEIIKSLQKAKGSGTTAG